MRETECFSMYSDMSRRIMERSSSNRNSASARASSVFPTPVGPRKINEPIGRLGSESPARFRRMEFATRSSAESCPITRWPQARFHRHQFLRFAFEQAPDGNARPLAHQLGDVLFAHFFLEHAAVLLHFLRDFSARRPVPARRCPAFRSGFPRLARGPRRVPGAALPL